jgi:hypothetical protein
MAVRGVIASVVTCVCLVALLIPAAAGATRPFAPLNQPGPPLSVPRAKLKAALKCERSVSNARVEPVLLNPATGVTARENYSWNWEPALRKLGIPWCAYTAPHNALGNIETSGEYLVYAIRTMYRMAHRPIAVMGHSQGGMSMRWALRFWPDTRPMVKDVIGFAGSNHGTTVANKQFCGTLGCAPASWQQLSTAHFIKALNSYAETFAGISYTEVYTHTDEVVQPNSGPKPSQCSSCLYTGKGKITNVATQQLCPTDVYEHLGVGTVDPVAYALGVSALRRRGPAHPGQIPNSVCSQVFMPGVNPANVNTELEVLKAAPGLLAVAVGPVAKAFGVPALHHEPPLACYVFAACSGKDAPNLKLSYTHSRSGDQTILRPLVRVREGYRLVPVAGALLTIGGHRTRTNAAGRAVEPVRLVAGRSYRLTASRPGCNATAATVRLLSRGRL